MKCKRLMAICLAGALSVMPMTVQAAGYGGDPISNAIGAAADAGMAISGLYGVPGQVGQIETMTYDQAKAWQPAVGWAAPDIAYVLPAGSVQVVPVNFIDTKTGGVVPLFRYAEYGVEVFYDSKPYLAEVLDALLRSPVKPARVLIYSGDIRSLTFPGLTDPFAATCGSNGEACYMPLPDMICIKSGVSASTFRELFLHCCGHKADMARSQAFSEQDIKTVHDMSAKMLSNPYGRKYTSAAEAFAEGYALMLLHRSESNVIAGKYLGILP